MPSTGRSLAGRILEFCGTWWPVAAFLVPVLLVLAGNVQVIDAIDGATWSDTQASQLGPARPGFESGHDLAALGAWGAVLATILAAGLLWRRQLASAKVAAAAAMVSLVVPYFIAPGAGVVVLAVSAAVARSRRDLQLAPSSFATPS